MEEFAELARRALQTFTTKNVSAVLALFAEDAIMIDPHYPEPEMRGKASIQRGLLWAFGNIETSEFTILRTWSEASQPYGVIEADTHHVFHGGIKLHFAQVFIVEYQANLIYRLQSFPSHGPPGLPGLSTGITRLWWRLSGKIK